MNMIYNAAGDPQSFTAKPHHPTMPSSQPNTHPSAITNRCGDFLKCSVGIHQSWGVLLLQCGCVRRWRWGWSQTWSPTHQEGDWCSSPLQAGDEKISLLENLSWTRPSYLILWRGNLKPMTFPLPPPPPPPDSDTSLCGLFNLTGGNDDQSSPLLAPTVYLKSVHSISHQCK